MTAPKLKVTYFNAKGRAEPTRLALTIGGIAFEDERIDGPTFFGRKESLPFGSLPVIEVDGRTISQSGAMLRYAGRLSGLYPSDALVAAKVDQLVDGCADVGSCLDPSFREQDAEKKLALRAAFMETSFPRYVGAIERLVEGPFAVGEELTIADLSIYGMVAGFRAGYLDGIPTDCVCAEKFPKICKLVELVDANPAVKAWNDAHAPKAE